MPTSSRLFTVFSTLALLAIGGTALAAPSASIEQVRNGTATASSTPVPTWGTGNAGASNSHYLESHSIAYRATLADLPTDGTVIELIIGYDVKRSGSYALDYLTHYQRLLPHVLFGHRQPEVFDPLAGVAGVGPEVSTAPIPVGTQSLVIDPDGSEPEPAAAQPSTSMAALSATERAMTLFGGTLIDVSYVSEADVSLAARSSEALVRVRFTASSPTAVLAWGGHIASRWDWGFNSDGSPRSAGGISGSSYHMRLVNWNLGNLGNQDRSMSTDAVYPVPRCALTNLGPFCAGTTNTHTAPAGMESYHWELYENTSGATIVGSDTSLSVVVRTTTGGSYTLLLVTGASGFTKQCQGTVTVNDPAAVSAGPDLASCSSAPQVTLAGWVGGGATSGTWSGGAGVFSPGRTALNATYTPTAAEITAGAVTLTLTTNVPGGTCPAASDAVRIVVTPAATANAGADLAVCASAPQAQLAGSVGGGATSGVWSGGEGVFSPGPNALNATYTPSAAEIAAGTVTLTLTSNDPDGPCAAAGDAMTIAIQPAATANAGADVTLCASAPQAQLQGQVGGGASSGSWTGGAGSFSPNRSTLNATYTPTAAEIAAGGVTLTLVSNDPAGPCGTASDAVRLDFSPAATANAGVDLVVCASSPQAQLAGSVGGGASSGTWSGAGTFSPSSSAMNATYQPTAAEIAAGFAIVTLTTNDPAGPCGAISDAVRITIDPAALANAGADRRVCASDPRVSLAGLVGGGATSGTWSGAGTFSPNATRLDAVYTPSAGEIASGRATITLTTNDPAGPCGPVSDAVTITIDPVTMVNAGADVTVCSSSPWVSLQGVVSGTVSTGTWSGGTGTFNPSRSALNASYLPSAAEIAAGSVTLTLTSSTPSGPCPAANDGITITIQKAVTANAGPDQIACAATPQVRLAGSIGNGATGGTWSGGSGSFSPNASTLDAFYTPSAGEVASGSVTLMLTTNDPVGPCPSVNDAMKITFDAPVVSVANRVVCSGISPVTMCAKPEKGVAPYTYRWNTGATTACITVADTGTYTVTMTDAQGCVATASGTFRHRDCIGMLAHTSTTCGSFMDGTGEDFNDPHWVIQDGVISSIAPGVFFYYTKVTAPRADFTIDLVQTRDNLAFPLIQVVHDQVSLYDSDCNRVGTGEQTTVGQASVAVTGATPGQVFIVSVKYSLKTLVGTPMPDSTGVRYDFRTEIDGVVVDGDPDGLIIGTWKPKPPIEGDAPVGMDTPRKPRTPTDVWKADSTGTTSTPAEPQLAGTFRPAPNPFRDGMRMAYEVGSSGESVSIRVYDLAGRLVRRLAEGPAAPGRHAVAWDGRNEDGVRVQGGMYFVHARIGGRAKQVRVTFLK